MSFGNKHIGTTTVKLGMYEESNDEHLAAALGQVLPMEDGRKFRLCKAGEALTAGILVQAPAPDAYDDELVVASAAAAGDKEVTITVTAGHGGYDKDALAEGFLMVTKGSGDIGSFYKIKGNDAMVAESTATITLYDKLNTALAATTNEVAVVLNPYNNVVAGSTTAPVLGVPNIAVTSGYYFWAQFAGPAPCTDSGSGVSAGDYVTHVGGDVITQDGSEDGTIGMAMNTAAANEGVIVFLTGLG